MAHVTSVLEWQTHAYPTLLRETPWPPEKLYCIGNVPNEVTVAIIGTRDASQEGLAFAYTLAAKLAERQICVVSGMARGIDTAAHEGALSVLGKTIAVLPCGILQCYPSSNRKLRDVIIQHGAALSEYKDGPALPIRCLERNRIIAGLARASVVVEAPQRSGALATARYAAEAGREVLVIPGRANDARYAGSHALIRDGATLATNVADVLEALGMR